MSRWKHCGAEDARAAQVVELRFFAGLEMKEIADALQTSQAHDSPRLGLCARGSCRCLTNPTTLKANDKSGNDPDASR